MLTQHHVSQIGIAHLKQTPDSDTSRTTSRPIQPPKPQFNTHPTMKSLSPVLASLANVFKIPLSQTSTRPAINRVCNEAVTSSKTTTGPITAAVQPAASRTFSTTSALAKRNAGAVPPQVNKRISTSYPSRRPHAQDIFSVPVPHGETE